MVKSKIRAVVVTIGDEILIGQVVNRNASWIGQQMNLAGFSVVRMVTVPDQEEAISGALEASLSHADIVLMTGGLGPTKDDITKHALATFFNMQLVEDQDTLRQVTSFFAARGMALTETNRKQAEVPEGCQVMKNQHGTAPGMLFEKDGKVAVAMPGVPAEMKRLMTGVVIPELRRRYQGQEIVHKTIMTHGMGESHLSDLIRDWEEGLPPHIRLAYLPRPGVVRLRLSAAGDSRSYLEQTIAEQVTMLKRLIPELVFGFDDITMEEVVGRMLRRQEKTVATAESCTGGAIASKLTSISGSSDYFKGAVVAYDNQVKQQLLGVTPGSLQKEGAVSKQVAEQMAAGGRIKMATDYAVATTGIAGPGGGTADKPAGTVWIAVASGEEVVSELFRFGNQRERNIERTVLSALNMLRKLLLKREHRDAGLSSPASDS
jgi:nicotinamide-nucleotide amidase